MFNFGAGEIIVVFLLVVFLFGPDKLQDLARQLGRFVAEFKKAGREFHREFEDAASQDDKRDPAKDSSNHA